MEAVVVSFESAKKLEGLLQCSALRRSFERIVVVDNASNDNSAEIAEEEGAHVIRHTENVGFGAAANSGIENTATSIVVLLNPDIRLHDEALFSSLGNHFQEPKVGLVAPALTLSDGIKQDSAREIPSPLDIVLRRNVDRLRGAVCVSVPTVVPWVVGACMMIRRKSFDDIGGFDERYFLYFEDVDLCVRLRDHGWQVVFDPSVSAEHHHAASSRKSFLGQSTRQHIRSATRFYRKHPRYLAKVAK